MTPDVRFEFDAEKVVQALAYFATRGVRDLTRLKAAKLLYFSDKAHLLRYGRPITGDHYYCMKLGPVPSEANEWMQEAEDAAKLHLASDELFSEHLSVHLPFLAQYPRFAAKRQPDLEVFSDSELEVLADVAETYGRKSARQLVDLAHGEECWKIASRNRPPTSRTELPYELFFEGASPDTKKLLDLIRAEQEDRDLAEQLAR